MTSFPGVPRVFVSILFVLLLVPATALAQTPSVPRGDLFGGVTFFNEDGSTFTGAQLTGALRTGQHFGVVGEVNFYKEHTTYMGGFPVFYEGRTTYMGGFRVYGPASKVTVFGQFLVGSAPLDDIAFQPGFGVDIPIGSRAAVRAAFDVKLSADGAVYVGTRFSTGIVINLGRR